MALSNIVILRSPSSLHNIHNPAVRMLVVRIVHVIQGPHSGSKVTEPVIINFPSEVNSRCQFHGKLDHVPCTENAVRSWHLG